MAFGSQGVQKNPTTTKRRTKRVIALPQIRLKFFFFIAIFLIHSTRTLGSTFRYIQSTTKLMKITRNARSTMIASTTG